MNASTDDRLTWKAYEIRETDLHGYDTVRFGVREEYDDGATRYIHNERFDTREEAQLLASRFNLLARKGHRYDNSMKQWHKA